jgi:hypothetical protein
VPFVLLLALAPVFRYDGWRQEWVLRGIGNQHGPVLAARSPRTQPTMLGYASGKVGALVPLAVLAAVVTAALGFMLAQGVSRGGVTRDSTARSPSGVFQIAVPPGWRAQPKASTGPRALTDQISLRTVDPGVGQLILGRVASNQADIAQALLGSAAASGPQTVTIGGAKFTRFVAQASATDPPYVSRSVTVLPTRLGMVAALCLTDAAGPAFMASCDRVLRAVGVSPRAPALPARYAADLVEAINNLNTTRTSAGSELARAKDARRQANAAQVLGQAHAAAAAKLRALAAGPARQANAAIVAALATAGRSYESLARAAEANHSQAYEKARGLVQQSQADLTAALRRLEGFGYSLG